MIRSVMAVGAGCLVFAAGLGALVLFQRSAAVGSQAGVLLVVVSLVYGVLWALGAGWVTATLARDGVVTHAVLLSLVITVAALYWIIAAPGGWWLQLVTMFVFAPSAIGGGYLRERQTRSRRIAVLR